MSNKIDTAEIRRLARMLNSCADEVQSRMIREIRKINSEVRPALEGNAGNALRERLETLQSDSQRAQQHLSAAAESMYRYAAALDEADRAASQMVNER